MDFEIDLALDRVDKILSKNVKEEGLEKDFIFKHIIEILFKEKDNIHYPNDKRISSDSLTKFVEITFSILNLNKAKRESFYNELNNITKEAMVNDSEELFAEQDFESNVKKDEGILKMDYSLNKNDLTEFKNLLKDLIVIINKTNMNSQGNTELTQKLNRLEDTLNSLLVSFKEDNDKFKKEIEIKEAKFNQEMKEMKNKLEEKETLLNQEINNLKKEISTVKSKEVSLELRIKELNEDSLKKGQKIDYFIIKLKKIYDMLLCPISFFIIKDPIVTPNGIIYDRGSIKQWIEKNKKRNLPALDPISHQQIDLNKCYPCKTLEQIIACMNVIYTENNLEE